MLCTCVLVMVLKVSVVMVQRESLRGIVSGKQIFACCLLKMEEVIFSRIKKPMLRETRAARCHGFQLHLRHVTPKKVPYGGEFSKPRATARCDGKVSAL